jgi:hypothetical protein
MASPLERRRPHHPTSSLGPLLLAWALAVVVLAIAAMQRSAPLDQVLVDAPRATGSPWYTGIVNNLTALAWTTSVIAAGGGAWIAAQTGRPTAARFLRTAAAWSALLLVDDLLHVRDAAASALGISRLVVLAVVVAAAATWAVRFNDEIARTRRSVLLVGAAALAGAGLVAATGDSTPTSLFAERAAELFGVLAVAVYVLSTSIDITRSTITSAMAPRPPVDGARPGDQVIIIRRSHRLRRPLITPEVVPAG